MKIEIDSRPRLAVAIGTLAVALMAAIALAVPNRAHAAEKFSFLTNWYAEAEHGGFYQALASGLYARAGLDVTTRRSTGCSCWPPGRPTA